MKVRVVVGFTAKTGATHLKGAVIDVSEDYATRLIERGRVVALDDTTKTSKRKSRAVKASKKNEQ